MADDLGPIEERPPILVYTRDLNRLREFGVANRCGDSAVALHKLLDVPKRAHELLGALVVISQQQRALERLYWWQFRRRRRHELAIRDTLTIVLDEGMVTRGSRVG